VDLSNPRVGAFYHWQSPLAPAHDEALESRFGENAINGIKDQGGFTSNEGERVDKEVVPSRRQNQSEAVNWHQGDGCHGA
jgi:hypothetical protein